MEFCYFCNRKINMNIIFEDKDLEELILTGRNNKYKKYSKDTRFMQALGRMYKVMCTSASTSVLKMYSFLHYEQLKGVDQSSVRVMNGRVERVLFRETENGIVITIIELNDTHYGNKR